MRNRLGSGDLLRRLSVPLALWLGREHGRLTIRHELIHRLQNERLGTLWALLSPEWFIEGMAYSLSEDPRTRLVEPFEQYRSQFDARLRTAGKEKLWEQARRL